MMDRISMRHSEVTILLLWFVTIAATLSIRLCAGSSDTICIESEREALLMFKQDLKDPSNRLKSWTSKVDCCKWAGVVCDNSTGHVHELHLATPLIEYDVHATVAEFEAFKRSRQLGGNINPSLINLKHLSHLDLSNNDFGGIQIPRFIGSLKDLRYLNLSDAGFGGVIPHHLGNLSSLRYLILGDYAYEAKPSSTAENLQWLSSLSLLQHLDMSGVNLSRAYDWLQVINILPSLVELHLSRCDLHYIGPLPHINFTSLAILDLSDNSFNCLLPRWVFKLSSLISLDLSWGGFQGSIPSGPQNLTSLRLLDLSSNYLNSSFPGWLFSLKGLVSLNLGPNNFQGPIPSGLQNMTGLRHLDLSSIGFNSSIPTWLYSFNRLESLNLVGNILQGTISSAIGNMTSITNIDLSGNEIEGRIPRALGNLCNLRVIRLASNKLEGEVSELFKTLSGCTLNALQDLDLDGNQLSGHLTDQLGQFKKLRFLYLAGNFISGPIPASLGRLSSLEYLDLSENKLNGTLPESLGRLSSLEYLRLTGNKLNGTLPESLGQLSKLVVLDISHNLLEGVVSENHFDNLIGLRVLAASENQLILNVSSNWIPPFQLETIQLRYWLLGPQYPMWLQSQRIIDELDLSCSGISDGIPAWFWNLSSHMSYLNLSHNQIHGEISYLPNSDVYDQMIYLSSNQFSGPLPRVSSNVSELDLSNNSFSGGISHLLCDSNDEPNQLEILHLGENILSGEIPDCWMKWQSLRVIKLGNNNLTGTIPNSIGFLDLLTSLHLRNNSLSGEVPLSLQNCTELWTVDLSENEFVGSIPTWMGKSLSDLMVLSLRSNKFHGRIPSQLCNLTSLQILDLANNGLSGTIPRCFNNFKAMATTQRSSQRISYSYYVGDYLENAFVVTKGREIQYDSILWLATSMDLSETNISGEIPEELTTLLGLLSLNLSGNHLTGMIPMKIGDMKSLESVDLSRNQLSGEIPPSMSGMTFLNYLNLSHNNLSGKIPLSTQLQSFSASSFIGNNLCGPPLVQNCSHVNGETPGIGNDGDNEDAKSGVKWFYLTITFGFVVGFWGVCGPLLYNKSWRIAYFFFLDDMWSKLCNCITKYL